MRRQRTLRRCGQLASDNAAMNALLADPAVFSALAANAGSFKGFAGQPRRSPLRSTAPRRCEQLQSAGISNAAIQAARGQRAGLRMLASPAAALAAIAGHSKAFAALAGHPAALARSCPASAFSSYASDAAFHNAASKAPPLAPMARNAAAFQQLASRSKAMSAIQADPQVFSAIGNNAARLRRPCQQRAQDQPAADRGDRQQCLGLLEPGQQCCAAELGGARAAGARRPFAGRFGGGGRDAQCGRLASGACQSAGVCGDDGQPTGIRRPQPEAAALAALAANQKAFAALAAQPNLAAVMANPSFSAALNQAGVSQSQAN